MGGPGSGAVESLDSRSVGLSRVSWVHGLHLGAEMNGEKDPAEEGPPAPQGILTQDPRRAPDPTEEYLLEFLQDEFRRYPEVRVRRPPYRDGSEGILVRTESREYFFEFRWLREKRFDEINRLVARIKDVLPAR
jgi:hypothetical protein